MSLAKFGLPALLFAVASSSLAMLFAADTKKVEPAKPAPAAKAPAPKKQEPPQKKDATSPADLTVLPGFKIELLYTADPATEGSWIAMVKDNKGRLIISGQPGQPILRATIADGKVAKLEKLDLKLSGAMGGLYAFDSLYLDAQGPQGYGLFRCRDTKGTDQYDEVTLLKRFAGGGEHGPHGVALGPDNRIYVMNGNHTEVPEGVVDSSPHRNYQEDLLLPRQWDGNGHAAGIMAPGGYVVRTDAEGKEWELVLAGFRNAYDIAFNGDGELFTFDSDMEWDWGMPWYRPTRVNHCVSAAEFGWRSGTGKWPSYYEDSLPATVDIGIGSPTGVGNGIGSKFPAKYQRAIYVMDWSYGRLMALHLKPDGASYQSTYENFVAPAGLTGDGPKKPLNVTDLVIGDDGAMYFTVGGRNTQAALYRVTYVGDESTAPAKLTSDEGSEARAQRRELEKFHGKPNAQAVSAAWPHLNSPDRFIRYAARLAIESQPVTEWQARAIAESQPRAAMTALMALARYGDDKAQAGLVAALEKFPLAKLDESLKLAKLRVLGVSFTRHGPPALEAKKKLITELEGQLSSSDDILNREAFQVLAFLHAPGAASKGLEFAKNAKTQQEQLFYVFHLRTLPVGNWTMEQRKEYLNYFTAARPKLPSPPALLQWFKEADRPYSDGASFNNFLKNFFREAIANLSPAERTELATTIESIDKTIVPDYDVKPRPVHKEWKLAEIEPLLDKAERGRNYDRGRQAYFAAQCVKCHRFSVEGGSIGPDLTAIASRFTRRQILESIVEPSKVLSDQFQNITITTTGGLVHTGRLMDENAERVVLQPNPLEPQRVEIKKSEIDSREPSKVSPMPQHLVNVLQEDEILDLLAFLESGGKKKFRAFQK